MHEKSSSERLNKFLAFHLGISRRRADELIERGQVAVGEQMATLGSRVEGTQTVAVNGKIITKKSAYTYLALHKPTGYVCSRKQQGDMPTIFSLLPGNYHNLKPVGRLDADSSGLILLTDDGDFAQQMTHPRHYKLKRYEILLDKDLEPLHQQMINDFGVQLEDGPSKLNLERMHDTSRRQWIVTMSEGRNRQIRRTFASLGYTVVRLHRFEFGAFRLDDLGEGEIRLVSPA
jgi:23S rRNA pseudouridine2605 synthase